MRVLTIFGTRPEAVKLAPVIMGLASEESVESITCVTAQHRGLLDQINSLFGLVPDYDLDLMRENQSLAEITERVFKYLPSVLERVNPDWVLVQGDTTTVMAASIAAYYQRIRVGHVEAGLRTSDKWHPFPEEINRRVAGVIADYHFSPTEHAKQNLIREGIPSKNIFVTGNTIIDALQYVVNKPPIVRGGVLETISWDKKIVLVTAHRRENFGKPLVEICEAVRQLAEDVNLGLHFVYPVHPNPHVYDTVHSRLGGNQNITLVPPLDYQKFVYLMSKSFLILTDSGGLQEEAPALNIPVLVMREVTERPEGIAAGVAKLVGSNAERIKQAVLELITTPRVYKAMASARNPYGDGKASQRIINILLSRN